MGGAGRPALVEWAIVVAPLVLVALGVTAFVRAAGRPEAVPSVLARRTGLPTWAAATVGLGLAAQVVTVTGVYWDVAWHVDLGRDKGQITPAHTLVLLGLALIVVAGWAGVVVARRGGEALPWPAVLVGLAGLGAFAGMPLDELWHRNYGVDLTMWGPTHLLMICGGNLGALGLWLALAEARAMPRGDRRLWLAHWAVACCVFAQLHIFQGEFDFGVPLFQLLYQPVLTLAAAGVVLVAARLVLGGGGALAVAGGYLAFRTGMAVFVGWGLDHSVPYVPLHLGSAAVVEIAAAALGTGRPLRFAAVSGIGLAAVGLLAERAWVGWFSPHAWDGMGSELFVVGGLAALAGATMGGALGALAAGSRPFPPALVALGAAGLLVALAVPFPRTERPVQGEVALQRQGDEAVVEVGLDPPGAATDLRWFEAFAWQGGGLVRSPLRETGPGVWRSEGRVPVAGDWKTVIRYHRGSDLLAFPVYFPADPEIGAPAVPALDHRVAAGEGDSDLLLREVHPGPTWPAVVAWAGIAAVVASWAWAGAAAVRSHRRSLAAPTPAMPN